MDNGRKLDPATLLTLRLALTDNKYHEPHRARALLPTVCWSALRALPGVRSATAVTAMPYSDHSNGRAFTIEGRPVDRGNVPSGMYQLATARAISRRCTFRCAAGRFLEPATAPDAPKVAVISQRMARTLVEERIAHRQAHPHRRSRIPRVPGSRSWAWWAIHAQPLRPRTARERCTSPSSRRRHCGWISAYERPATRCCWRPAVTAAIRAVDPEQPITDMRTHGEGPFMTAPSA